jgi:broad specificity phosphatase PhoE
MTGCRQNVPRHAGLAWRGKTAVSMTRQQQLDSSYSLSITLSIMMASSQIYLVRHAESAHNISKDFSQPDPPLTPLGLEQAAKLEQTFPHSAHIGLVITSPLKRAIQTALSGFSHILDKRYYDSSSKLGVEGGAELIIDPGLQERSALPCDTGSDQDVLSEIFPRLNFERLWKVWQVKVGLYAENENVVEERARKVRRGLFEAEKGLKEREKNDIIVVTHGMFMKYLSEDPAIDMPKAGWKTYRTRADDEGNVRLVPVEHSAPEQS